MPEAADWSVRSPGGMPDSFVAAVRQVEPKAGHYTAQLLWQRGIREDVAEFLQGEPESPVPDRLAAARQLVAYRQQRVVIDDRGGDLGGAAAAVLWEGLGWFFPNLDYRTTGEAWDQEWDLRVSWGGSPIASSSIASSSIASSKINHLDLKAIAPLDLPVVVAYRLVEALAEVIPEVSVPIETLLDVVAIGLLADWGVLRGESRALAQRGIAQLQRSPRPGVARLVELCQRSGDRVTDVAQGIGPRIQALSQIRGDRLCVELLTTPNQSWGRKLAEETELANARRKGLQREIAQQVRQRVAQLDLSTVRAIVLEDAQWSAAVLGWVAEQMVQEYGCPVVLLGRVDPIVEQADAGIQADSGKQSDAGIQAEEWALGVARSPEDVDLAALIRAEAQWLTAFSGDSLSLPVGNIGLFTEALNRRLRLLPQSPLRLQTDLTVTVMELGQNLFRELKLLEPYGIGNPVPKLLIQNCWFSQVWHRNIEDWRGRKVRYIKTEFEIWDDSTELGFPGVWWEHYRDEIPPGRCDAIAELDFNPAKKRYEIRLIAVRPTRIIPTNINPPFWGTLKAVK
jgi:single-stranded-DNA-specific exonuclease